MTPHIFSPRGPRIAFLLGALLASPPIAAAGRPCSGLAMPTVEVVPRLSNPQFNSQTPGEQLSLAALVSRPGETDGLTDFQVSADLNLQENPKTGGCPVRAIQAVIKPSRLEVYIAKEVLPSSCRFRAVYEHELKHVMLAQKAIDRSAAPLRRKLLAAVEELTPAQARDVEAIRAALSIVIGEQLTTLTAEYVQDNTKLDTPEEALRMERVCGEPQAFVGDRPLLSQSLASAANAQNFLPKKTPLSR